MRVAPIADRAARALRQLTSGAFLSVAVQTSETMAMPYDQTYAIATPGRALDMFTNQAHVLRTAGPRHRGGSLMLFAGAHGATALMQRSDETIVERFLADLHELVPETRGVIASATVHRWELGNVYYNLPSASGVTLTAAQLRELPVTCLKGHRGRRRGRDRADPDRRPDAPQRMGHAHLCRPRRRRPRRRLRRRPSGRRSCPSTPPRPASSAPCSSRQHPCTSPDGPTADQLRAAWGTRAA